MKSEPLGNILIKFHKGINLKAVQEVASPIAYKSCYLRFPAGLSVWVTKMVPQPGEPLKYVIHLPDKSWLVDVPGDVFFIKHVNQTPIS